KASVFGTVYSLVRIQLSQLQRVNERLRLLAFYFCSKNANKKLKQKKMFQPLLTKNILYIST
ncbi:hypothetical protein, partial [Weissella paramesenteroides]